MTPKQKRFVEEYLVDLNATQAYLRAGYSEEGAGQSGFNLLKNTEIQEAIRKAMQERSARTQITADRVLEELALIGFARTTDVMTWGPNGVNVRNSGELGDAAAAVAEVSESATKEGDILIKVKMHDKQAALVSLGRHLGLFQDKVKHDFGQLSDSELVSRAAGLLGGVVAPGDKPA